MLRQSCATTLLVLLLSLVSGCGTPPAQIPVAFEEPQKPQQAESTSLDVKPDDRAAPRCPTWTELGKLEGNGGFKGLAFLPESHRLISGSFDGMLQVWDTNTLKQVKSIQAHDGLLGTFAISDDGRFLASVDFKRNLKIWDTNTWDCIATHRAGCVLYSVAFSPDGITLATTGERVVEFWRVGHEEKLKQIDVENWPITGLAFSQDGRTLLVTCMDNIDDTLSSGEGGVLRAYDVNSLERIGEFKTRYQPSMHSLTMSPDGTQVLMACMVEVHSLTWSRQNSRVAFEERYKFSRIHQRKPILFEAQFAASAFQPHTSRLAISAASPGPLFPETGHVEVLNATTGEPIAALTPERSSREPQRAGTFDITRVAFSSDGSVLAMAGNDQAITLWREVDYPESESQSYQSPEMTATPLSDHESHSLDDAPENNTANGKQFHALHKEYRVRFRDFVTAGAQAKNQRERDALFAASFPQPDDYVPKLINLARADPTDTAALDSLAFAVWLLRSPPAFHLESDRANVIQLLRDGHMDDADLSRVFYLLENWPWNESPAFLRDVAETSPHPKVRGHAWFSLGNWYAQRAETVRRVTGDKIPATDSPLLSRHLDTLRRDLAQAVPDDFISQAESCYDRVIDDFPSVIQRPNTYVRLADPEHPGISGWRKRLLGELAPHARSALHHSSIGQLAKEIEGEDSSGEVFKLSDYRGKVVVLAFSGNWCGSCIAMYPQYREMVERLADRPFVLLHVNSDSSREEVQRDMKDGKITWRCWWDGGSTNGPIATQWQVKAWPVIYVLDKNGIIRHKDLRGAPLDEAVEKLLLKPDRSVSPGP